MEELLRRSNLERFIPKFQEEEIDLEVLLLCEEKDLVDLGLPKGPRVKLARAIAGILAGTPAPSTVEELEKKLAELRSRIAAAEDAAEIARTDRTAAETRLRDVEQQLVIATGAASTATLSDQAKGEVKQMIAMSVGSQVSSINEEMRSFYSQLAAVQEAFPNKVLWTIRNISEKLRSLPPGKHLRAPSFAVCGFLSGVKLDFYPQGRTEEEGTLPEITPRRSVPGQKLPSSGVASVALCMPMGIKIQYHLQIGRQNTFDSRYADWTWVFHDFKMDWTEALAEGDSVTIMFCVAKLHNRRFLIEGDTVFVRSD